MGFKFLYSLCTFCILIYINNFSLADFGQNLPPPPIERVIDSYGVDYLNGSANMPGMTVSIGTSESGIKRDPGRNWYGLDNFTGTLTQLSVLSSQTNSLSPGYGLPVGEYLMVSTGDNSEVFKINSGAYSAFEGAKGSFECPSNEPNFCYYTSNQGVIVKFDKTKTNGYSSSYRENQVATYKTQNKGLMVEIKKTSGEVISLTYTPNTYFDPQNRLLISAAVSSMGWMLKYQYSP